MTRTHKIEIAATLKRGNMPREDGRFVWVPRDQSGSNTSSPTVVDDNPNSNTNSSGTSHTHHSPHHRTTTPERGILRTGTSIDLLSSEIERSKYYDAGPSPRHTPPIQHIHSPIPNRARNYQSREHEHTGTPQRFIRFARTIAHVFERATGIGSNARTPAGQPDTLHEPARSPTATRDTARYQERRRQELARMAREAANSSPPRMMQRPCIWCGQRTMSNPLCDVHLGDGERYPTPQPELDWDSVAHSRPHPSSPPPASPVHRTSRSGAHGGTDSHEHQHSSGT